MSDLQNVHLYGEQPTAPIPCPVNWNSDGTNTHKRFKREPMFRFVESTYIESTFEKQAKKKNFCFLGKPHMRGEDTPIASVNRNKNRNRNIPTCVGKTPAFTSACTLAEEHPHMRGEDVTVIVSPAPLRGNIPTCVGKTIASWKYGSGNREHPHIRGEDHVGRY